MNGFVLLASNSHDVEILRTHELETEIKRREIRFLKNEYSNSVYSNIFGYQLLKDKDNINKIDSNHLIAGDIYGPFENYNGNLLKYSEAIQLINNSNISKEYTAFEGNACIGSIFKDNIVFQNDLEGYRKIFYYQDNKVLCISTSLVLVLKAINNNWKLRRNAVISLICSRESKWPLTFVEDVFTLPPLSRAVFSKSGINITSKIFSDFYELKKTSKSDLREQLYNQYKIIVQRKVGDNTAVTLSGGFDSNCLTKLYYKIHKNNFTAISVGYEAQNERDGNINDETVYAKNVAQRLNIPFKRYLLNRTAFFKEFYDFIDTIDQPGHDPSSNFVMNKHLHADGFDMVVNGMGGDANFTTNINILLGLKLYKLSKITGSEFVMFLGQSLKYRPPFHYFKSYSHLNKINSFHDLFERTQLFRSPICKYVDTSKQIEIDRERSYRDEYFNKLYEDSISDQEISYSLALFTNPDEYHALSMAERNNIEILMPFVNTKAALLMMNGSHFNKVNTRDFEMSIFGGIDTDLLAKSKSGFSIPYAEWLPPLRIPEQSGHRFRRKPDTLPNDSGH